MWNRLKNRVLTRKRQEQASTSMKSDVLIIQATYNYGISMFHLGQDWAYEHAVDAFEKVLNELAAVHTPTLIEMRELAQGSLSCTYAKLANRNPQQRDHYCELTFELTRQLLDNGSANQVAKALAFAANGLAHMSQEKYDRAMASFMSALEFDNNIIALLGIGEAYLKSGKREEALDAYQKANQMTMSGGYAAYRLGNLLRELNNKELAVEAYRRASALSVARLALGKIYLDDEEFEDALDEFRNAVQINRKNSEALVNIAWTILEMQNADDELIQEAVQAARRSVQIDKGNANEWHRRTILALSLLAAQLPERALREANLGLDLAPGRSQTKFCVALCEFHLGRRDQARNIVLEILHSNERGIWRTKAERLMQELKDTESKD
jgi:tetratricopeptide (TPR) repeat protein